MQQYKIFQLELFGEEPEENYVGVDLSAYFTQNGKTVCVKGFYTGEGRYCIRYLPLETGICKWQIETSIKFTDVEMSGFSYVDPAADRNHGPVRTLQEHFQYEDGTDYLPFGTTVYALLHQDKELVDQTMDTLKKAPFNKVRMCIFPKYFDFNRNEPEVFPFEKSEDGNWNVRKPDFTFWNMLDKRLEQLGEFGIEADLILLHPYDCWGLMNLSPEEYKVYFDYVLRRISAYPNIWWSLANEYDQFDSLEQEDWENFAAYIGMNDLYHHLLSNHNFVHPWDFSNPYTTHCCLQSADSVKIPALLKRYGKPVIYDEMGYEGNIPYNWGNISAFELVNRFWKTFCMGGYASHGETYMEKMDDDQILWWSKGGILKGESVQRIAFMREIFESMPQVPDLYHSETGFAFETQEELKSLVAKGVKGIADNLVFKCMAKMQKNEFEHMKEFFTQPILHCGDKVWLTYLGDACTIYTALELPETKEFTVEVIDVWEMTRMIVNTKAKGRTEISLPGKPGIAVMAKANDICEV